MGKAIVLNNIDFTASNLGKVIFSDSAGNIPVTSIQTDSDKSTFKVGESATITAIVSPSGATNSNVRWSTSSNAIATLTSTGNTCTVTGLATGTVTITCTSESNSSIKSTEVLSITDILLTNLTINGSVNVTNNSKYTVSYIPSNTTQKGVIWSTSNTNIATIDSSGNLTVVSNGVVTVTAISSINNAIIGHLDVTCALLVIEVSGINLTSIGSPTTLNIGNSLTINAEVLPVDASDKSITWSVSNSNASITSSDNEQCIISGLTAGNVTVTATSNADTGITASYNLTVQFVYITGITITSNIEILRVGNSLSLVAAMLPSNATDKAVVWSINSADATISANGDSCTVNAVSEGSITVTATAVDGSNIIGTWTTTILEALQVDTTLKVHLEAEDYVESSEAWVDRASNLTAYVYGSPEKSVSGLTFSLASRYQRFILDISSIYSGGDFTLYVEGIFNYTADVDSKYIMCLGDGTTARQVNMITRGPEGLSMKNFNANYTTTDEYSYYKGVIVFDRAIGQFKIYGINNNNVVFFDTNSFTTNAEYATFLSQALYYLGNARVVGTGTQSSSGNVENEHTIKTVKMYNVAKTVEEVTAMLTT